MPQTDLEIQNEKLDDLRKRMNQGALFAPQETLEDGIKYYLDYMEADGNHVVALSILLNTIHKEILEIQLNVTK